MSGRRRTALAAGTAGLLCLLGTALTAGHQTTYAAFTDYASTQGRVAAGVWTPDPPEACGDVDDYAGVVWGTPGDDVMNVRDDRFPQVGHNRGQIVMGLGGDDTLHGGTHLDCLVGGDGDDRLFGGNGKDVLLGGAGDDHLDGGTAKDALDGGHGFDTCLGGLGQDTVVNCESTSAARLAPPPQETAAPESAPGPAREEAPDEAFKSAPETGPETGPETAAEPAPEPDAADPAAEPAAEPQDDSGLFDTSGGNDTTEPADAP